MDICKISCSRRKSIQRAKSPPSQHLNVVNFMMPSRARWLRRLNQVPATMSAIFSIIVAATGA